MTADPTTWLSVTSSGLYCVPGDFFIDPTGKKDRAVITHGHGDHARPGHRNVLTTAETAAIMAERYGAEAIGSVQTMAYGETVEIGGVRVTLLPAGHILGSAQVVMEYGGARVIASGDYKRRADPTCAGFEVMSADVFITEATFALPVFRHPPDSQEIEKLTRSLCTFPDRTHLVGAYGLGKCQRVIALLRAAGVDETIYLHGAMPGLCDLYRSLGVDLGRLAPAGELEKKDSGGRIVLCPPSALNDRWSRRFADPVTAMASGWMRVRQRAKQGGVEIPLVISDHADWDELTATLHEVAPRELWVTHGREDALVHYATTQGFAARALRLVGFDEDSA
jgi:putative mRNA 3-end processing factor